MFPKNGPLFYMLLKSFAFCNKSKEKSKYLLIVTKISVIFVHFLKQFQWKCENENFRCDPTL